MIAIVDYGLGNVRAFLNAFARLDIPAMRASTATELRTASRIILPGVGAFDQAMRLLAASGMQTELEKLVCSDRVPILGVCVGMQILANGSEEGSLQGLGWIPGQVRSLDGIGKQARLPHMGWNDAVVSARHGLFAEIANPRFYFLHSFFFDAVRREDVAATTVYGASFPCAVVRENVFGVQFHPEKSHHWGQTLLHNFATAKLC